RFQIKTHDKTLPCVQNIKSDTSLWRGSQDKTLNYIVRIKEALRTTLLSIETVDPNGEERSRSFTKLQLLLNRSSVIVPSLSHFAFSSAIEDPFCSFCFTTDGLKLHTHKSRANKLCPNHIPRRKKDAKNETTEDKPVTKKFRLESSNTDSDADAKGMLYRKREHQDNMYDQEEPCTKKGAFNTDCECNMPFESVSYFSAAQHKVSANLEPDIAAEIRIKNAAAHKTAYQRPQLAKTEYMTEFDAAKNRELKDQDWAIREMDKFHTKMGPTILNS
ncbi:hypothetical protein HDU99_008559, partial [Rhizoclosmatium hyalinum]